MKGLARVIVNVIGTLVLFKMSIGRSTIASQRKDIIMLIIVLL